MTHCTRLIPIILLVCFASAALGAATLLYDGTISTVAGTGAAGYTGDGGQATAAKTATPLAVALDDDCDLYFSADHKDHFSGVRKVNTYTGVITTVAGTTKQGYSGDGGAATAAKMDKAEGIALHPNGDLYIADTKNNRIRKVDVGTGIITTIAGTGTGGFSGDGGAATAAKIDDPKGVDVDINGHIYIADKKNARIRKVDGGTGIITTIAGTGTGGFSGDGGAATAAKLDDPEDVAVDCNGNVYIADKKNERIRRVDGATGIITTYAGTGTGGYSGDGGAATAAKIDGPSGVAVDRVGNLFIADKKNERIRRVDVVTGIITTVAGTGAAGYSGDGGAATSAKMNSPTSVAVNCLGDIYIADSKNNRVRFVDVRFVDIADQIITSWQETPRN